MEDEIDTILLNFAKRIEALPRGKTYGWEGETAAIKELLAETETRSYDTGYQTGYNAGFSTGKLKAINTNKTEEGK